MKKIDIKVGDRVTLTMPASEVCMHMRVYGKPMQAELLESGMVQLFDLDGREFSMPITTGEAGVYGYQKVGYYAYTEYGAVKYTHLGVTAHFPNKPLDQLDLLQLACATFGFLLNCSEHRGKWISWQAFGKLIVQHSDSSQAKVIAAAMNITLNAQKEALHGNLPS